MMLLNWALSSLRPANGTEERQCHVCLIAHNQHPLSPALACHLQKACYDQQFPCASTCAHATDWLACCSICSMVSSRSERRTGSVDLSHTGTVDGCAEDASLSQLLHSCLVELTPVEA